MDVSYVYALCMYVLCTEYIRLELATRHIISYVILIVGPLSKA